MDEITIQELIRVKYSGAMAESSVWLNLAVQTALVVFGGIIIWRVSNLVHKRKLDERKRNNYFETPYSKGWKRK